MIVFIHDNLSFTVTYSHILKEKLLYWLKVIHGETIVLGNMYNLTKTAEMDTANVIL